MIRPAEHRGLMLNYLCVLSAVIQSKSNTEDSKGRDENDEHVIEKDSKEQFRRRQPRTKPANP